MTVNPKMGGSLVHIVDDDESVRDSLLELLASVGLAAVAYASGAELLAARPAPESGCVVTDVQMPGMSGLELLDALRARQINIPVVVLTGHADVKTAVAALKGGAVDFVEKPIDPEAMITAVTTAINFAGASAAQVQNDPLPDILAGLSPREREVLEGLIKGQSNKMIANGLGISFRTVEVYRSNIMAKLNAETLSDLLRLVYRGPSKA